MSTAAPDRPADASPVPAADLGSPRYRAYVLGLLVAAYTLNGVDRSAVGIIQEPIRAEFGLTDFQLGLLGGPTFALLYSVLGIPIARLAETGNRVRILAAAVLFWSAMTMACGFAASFVGLLVARALVSVGEAGCSPPANSIICDYYPPQMRVTALSIYSLGVPLGSILAAIGGGWLASNFGWREAFIWLGAPGILLAAIIWFTAREPLRTAPVADAARVGDVLRVLAGKPTYWHICVGSALASVVGYGVKQYLTSFLIRSHGLSMLASASAVAVGLGVCTAVGAFGIGYVVDRISPRHPTALAWLPAIGLALAAPAYLLVFFLADIHLALAALMVAAAVHAVYMGPMFAVTQSVVAPRMRATSLALTFLVINLVGYGIGPPAIGALSDALANHALLAHGLTRTVCDAQHADPTCKDAIAGGLRGAMMITSLVQLWAAAHFLLAARTLRRDVVS